MEREELEKLEESKEFIEELANFKSGRVAKWLLSKLRLWIEENRSSLEGSVNRAPNLQDIEFSAIKSAIANRAYQDVINELKMLDF